MSTRLAAAVFALVALPVAAQTSPPRAEGRSPQAPLATPATAAKAKAGTAATPKQRARLAKAQNKQARKKAVDPQASKKAPAT